VTKACILENFLIARAIIQMAPFKVVSSKRQNSYSLDDAGEKRQINLEFIERKEEEARVK